MNGAVSKKRWLMEIGIGFMLGRVWVFSINPFGLAYLCASGVYPAGRGLVFLSVLAGFITKAKGLDFLHYVMMTGLLWFVQKIMKKVDGKEGSCQAVAAIGGILNVVLSVTTGFLQHGTTSVVFTAALESICLIAFAYVMQWGLRFLLYEDWERELSNEEMISVLVLAALSVYGMPRLFDGVLSIVETMSYLLVLFAGYRYGAAVGAMAGAVGGILSVAGGSDMILIGVYCVLGITVGIFREIGRIVSVITFVAAGIVFAYVIRDEVLGIVELRGMVSAGIVFLAVPRELVRTIETDFMRERENPFAKADLMRKSTDFRQPFCVWQSRSGTLPSVKIIFPAKKWNLFLMSLRIKSAVNVKIASIAGKCITRRRMTISETFLRPPVNRAWSNAGRWMRPF